MTMRGVLVFSGTGPLLILSSYPTVDHPELVAKLRAKGLRKFIAYEIPIDRCKDLYGSTYRDIVADLETSDDMRVLDFDGHRIFLNFSLRELGAAFVYEEEDAARTAAA
ncbi:MAG TPA: hypothetical protein VLA35_00690 [Thermoleophilia bacterium]|jgi:hypothetical protein|nr:hypothetical protein [Thermoleophilia bacterium]